MLPNRGWTHGPSSGPQVSVGHSTVHKLSGRPASSLSPSQHPREESNGTKTQKLNLQKAHVTVILPGAKLRGIPCHLACRRVGAAVGGRRAVGNFWIFETMDARARTKRGRLAVSREPAARCHLTVHWAAPTQPGGNMSNCGSRPGLCP